MSCLNDNCSSAGFDLVALSSSLAILISNNFDTEDLAIIATFVTTLGDNLSLIAASRASCELKNKEEL